MKPPPRREDFAEIDAAWRAFESADYADDLVGMEEAITKLSDAKWTYHEARRAWKRRYARPKSRQTWRSP